MTDDQLEDMLAELDLGEDEVFGGIVACTKCGTTNDDRNILCYACQTVLL